MRYNGGKLSSKDIRSLCDDRMALDRMVAQLVVERATDAELHELEPLLDEMRAERDLTRCCELVTEFYHRLAEISGNIFLSLLYNSTFEPQKGIYVLILRKKTAPSRSSLTPLNYMKVCSLVIPNARRTTCTRPCVPPSAETTPLSEHKKPSGQPKCCPHFA